jgi:hypothetical protein
MDISPRGEGGGTPNCTDQEISKLLSSCDYGISTTPYLLVQKKW